MSSYPFAEIEAKWQKIWEDQGLYRTDLKNPREKFYSLVMFPYPSGDRLHIGHWYNFGPADAFARYKRMRGYNVFEPIGYDAFGLPAENYAIKVGIHPRLSIQKNIEKFRQQLKAIGGMYDFSKEINTSSSDYYRWTQWFFLVLYHNGLAYRKMAPVNWCPKCMTVLANEQVVNGLCERCESQVTKKDLEQWFFKITDYAEKLLEGHDRIDWPEKTITMQKNWIGRSEGAQIRFKSSESNDVIEVFTTRPDTLFGVTYMVLAPEHPLVAKLTTPDRKKDVEHYVKLSRMASDIDRTSTEREKTGVFIGAYAANPINNEKVPIWIADYVLLSYGTGCVMAVPAHDERDFAFAMKFNLPIREVISPNGMPSNKLERAYIDPGIMINSDQFTGMESRHGIKKVIDFLEENNLGESKVNYKLRDWLVSRQRYWGAPIPVVYCKACGIVPVPEAELPVLLPDTVEFTGKGESPLLTNPEFLHTTCPKCGGPATREVDTMDTFVCSSWYFLRYLTPESTESAFDKELVNKWLPVDQYIGGAEHAVMHLLYARFFIKVLYDLGMVNFDEPFKRLFHQGTITRDGFKMSKSRGNVVSPDKFISDYGSDTFRMYMMFMGNYAEGGNWSDEGIIGISRFLNRVWRMIETIEEHPPMGAETIKIVAIERSRHYTAKMVTQDLERFHFNTAISRIMEMVNEIYLYFQNVEPEEQNRQILLDACTTVLLLMAPLAPHISEELWHRLGNKESIFNTPWPDYDEEKIKTSTIPIVIQVNGKVRDTIEVSVDASDDEVIDQALAVQKIRNYVADKQIVKKIVVKNKLINLVVR